MKMKIKNRTRQKKRAKQKANRLEFIARKKAWQEKLLAQIQKEEKEYEQPKPG